MPDRDNILHKVRVALGRRGGESPERIPPARLAVTAMSHEQRVERLFGNLAARRERASSLADCRVHVAAILAGRQAVALEHPLLGAAGILQLPGVTKSFAGSEELRAACASAQVGISAPAYALADPGALVVFSTARDDRLVSLLPPAHIAVIEAGGILSGLDELFERVPDPAEISSAMVLIGGPSRTGDIEMTMVEGVHGPGELNVFVI
jgi:L-lactate dehydrogenase complex protein LldG